MSASGSTSKRPLPAAALAPGFRFRPSDDELVTYYLKRKISGRPIRADAIGEVDLYKSEPWDLPSMSPLQSNGAMEEWYFFTLLDRKHSNSFRTDRSTVHGYWKPTGEDRPVRRGTRIVGMKKTLAFHFGRAPHGQRTNWIMNEYRLEDKELITAGIQQDAYVVCKIFLKNDSEPHSGASITEEKWEEAGDCRAGIAVEGDGIIGEGYLQLSDFEHNNDMDNQGERTALLTSPDGQNNGIHLEDPFLLEDVFEDVIHDMSVRGLQGNQVHYNDIDGNSGIPVLSHGSPIHNEAYLELNDLRVVDHGDYPSDDDSVDYLTMILQERYEAEEFFDSVYEDIDSPILQASPIVHGGSYVEQNDLTPADGHYPSDPTADDNAVFYDILNGDLGSAQGSFIQMSDFLYSPLDDRSTFSMVDETMDYLVSNDNNLYYSALDSSEEFQLADSPSANLPNIFPEVDGSSTLPNMAIPSEANVGRSESASSSLRSQTDARSDSLDEDVTVEQGSEGDSSPEGTLKRRILNMLGSISAPPAFASELPVAPIKSTGKASTADSASSIHVTTGMIQIHGFKLAGHAEPWSLPNSRDVGFFVPYGMASNEFDHKSVMLQGGLSLFFLSVLFLAICFKIGVWVCSR